MRRCANNGEQLRIQRTIADDTKPVNGSNAPVCCPRIEPRDHWHGLSSAEEPVLFRMAATRSSTLAALASAAFVVASDQRDRWTGAAQ
jgi:hypothetical protein